MTFCLGINIHGGLIGIADTRVVSGTERITARKLWTYQRGNHAMFVMTAGLRSVRDKTLTYFEEALAERDEPFDRLFRAVNLYAEQVRRVALEDRAPLELGGLHFNLQSLVGGQMAGDDEHKLFLVYSEGNWVEVGQATPYQIIGETGYGKPILDRTLKYEDPMRFAFKVGCLAFDSTRISAADVGFPIDVVLYQKDSFEIVEHRYQQDDLVDISRWWQDRLRHSIDELPSEWIERAFSKLTPSTVLPAE